MKGVAAGATVLINVNGGAIRAGNFGLFGFSCDKTVWNFYQATYLSLTNVGWVGSVLAPCADFDEPEGVSCVAGEEFMMSRAF